MKKIIIALAIVLSVSLTTNAQSDGWFKASGDDYSQRAGTSPDIALPGSHGLTNDQASPLGSGLIILGALGAGYAIARRKRD